MEGAAPAAGTAGAGWEEVGAAMAAPPLQPDQNSFNVYNVRARTDFAVHGCARGLTVVVCCTAPHASASA